MIFCQKLGLLFIFIFFGVFVEASHECELSGILVRKYFPVPEIVKNPCFGWFIELEPSSSRVITDALAELDEEEQRLYSHFGNECVQLMLPRIGQPEQCREFENQQVLVKGKLWNPPHIYRPIPSYQLELDEMETIRTVSVAKNAVEEKRVKSFVQDKIWVREREFDPTPAWGHKYVDARPYDSTVLELPEGAPEILVKLQGKLYMMLFPGPPEYLSVECGDVPEYGWFLTLDEKSFQIASSTPVAPYGNSMEYMMESPNWFKVQLSFSDELEKRFYHNVEKAVTVEGYLFHAMTGHHHAPFLMNVQSVYAE